MMQIGVEVFGLPQPQGSVRAFLPKGGNRPVLTCDNAKVKPWRQDVAALAAVAMHEKGQKILSRPRAVQVKVTFYFQKPKSSGKNIQFKTTKPDLDKLLRALLDALTGIAFEDDAQVVACHVYKAFGVPARTEILVTELT